MRKHLSMICAVLLMAACSSPKYTYNFDYHNYNSGSKQQGKGDVALVVPGKEVSPLALSEQALVASAEASPVVLSERPLTAPVTAEEAKTAFTKKYKEMSKSERKEFRREIKKDFKAYMKAKKEGDHVAAANAVSAMDNDLKMAIIFGAVGLTLTLFGGIAEAFWILGVIAIVVGVVFFIKWLVRQ